MFIMIWAIKWKASSIYFGNQWVTKSAFQHDIQMNKQEASNVITQREFQIYKIIARIARKFAWSQNLEYNILKHKNNNNN